MTRGLKNPSFMGPLVDASTPEVSGYGWPARLLSAQLRTRDQPFDEPLRRKRTALGPLAPQ